MSSTTTRKTPLSEREDLEGLLIADGFDEAFIGVGLHFDQRVAVYDEDACIGILMREGMTYTDAREYFDFNVTGAYFGPGTPVFVSLDAD